jgi:hypothetical protein
MNGANTVLRRLLVGSGVRARPRCLGDFDAEEAGTIMLWGPGLSWRESLCGRVECRLGWLPPTQRSH